MSTGKKLWEQAERCADAYGASAAMSTYFWGLRSMLNEAERAAGAGCQAEFAREYFNPRPRASERQRVTRRDNSRHYVSIRARPGLVKVRMVVAIAERFERSTNHPTGMRVMSRSLPSAAPAIRSECPPTAEMAEAKGRVSVIMIETPSNPPPGESSGLVYSRFNHPNSEIVEDRLAAYEQAESCILFSSGMSEQD